MHYKKGKYFQDYIFGKSDKLQLQIMPQQWEPIKWWWWWQRRRRWWLMTTIIMIIMIKTLITLFLLYFLLPVTSELQVKSQINVTGIFLQQSQVVSIKVRWSWEKKHLHNASWVITKLFPVSFLAVGKVCKCLLPIIPHVIINNWKCQDILSGDIERSYLKSENIFFIEKEI